jgi:hypothetical protein
MSVTKFLFTIGLAISFVSHVGAIPFLQLDVGAGTYVGGTDETTHAQTDPFTLYALVDSTNSTYAAGTTYFLSVAIVPKQGVGANTSDFGSFTITPIGGSFTSSSGWIYGTPPVDLADSDSHNLSSHGIFETYYQEFQFTTLPGKATQYNVQDDPGDPVDNALGTLLYQSFLVDARNMGAGYELHFDLYTVNPEDNEIAAKAPFSHDAQSGGTSRVPDGGATFALLGFALVGVEGLRRKFAKRVS